MRESKANGRLALIQAAGGIVVGQNELVTLGQLQPGEQIPPLPAWVSESFLNSQHPGRRGLIKSRSIYWPASIGRMRVGT